MKKQFFLLLMAITSVTLAQITITKNDMPVANDTVRISNTNTVGSSNPAVTGANHTWDYTHLVPLTQKIDTFVSVGSTPFLYQLYFNNSILYPNTKADVALPVATPALTTGLTLSDVFNYYKSPTSQYTQVGFGAKINGIATSVRFDSLDVIYRFPMNYGNKDSCISKYAFTVPTLMYYGQRKKRVNEVDGWGTLQTPYGSFQTLRVKTTLYVTDTIYLTSFSFGTKITRPVEIEYKWLGANSKIPLLQINTTAGTSPVVISVVYRDSLRGTLLSNEQMEANVHYGFSASVVAQAEAINLQYTLNTKEDVLVELFDIIGNKVNTLINETQQTGFYNYNTSLQKASLAGGVYIIKASIGDEFIFSEKIFINPN